MAAPVRTGTAITVDASAGDGSTSITVPADCTLVVAFWAHWDGDNDSTLSGLTLNSAGFTRSQLADLSANDEIGVGVGYLESPSTGSQTLAWTWSAGGARTEGGEIVVVYVKDHNAGDPVRDTDHDAASGNTNVSVVLTTASTDLVLGFGTSYSGGATLTATIFHTDTLNSHLFDVTDATAGASTTTIQVTNGVYPSVAGISLKESTGGGGSTVPVKTHNYRRRRVA